MPTLLIGKGLIEPVSPFRTAYWFGAEPYTQNADNWNAIPNIWDQTDSFNLSTISLYHEVVVVLLGLRPCRIGEYTYKFDWYRERDNHCIGSITKSLSSRSTAWVYVYSYIGWWPTEISENGNYRVEVTVTGAEEIHLTKSFSVSGMPAEAPPVELPLPTFMQGIVDALDSIRVYFESAYWIVEGWIWPFNLLASLLAFIAEAFGYLTGWFTTFRDWVLAVTSLVSSIFSEADILRLLRTWLTYAEDAWSWIVNYVENITDIIATWWDEIKLTVLGWIDIAKTAVLSIIDTVIMSVTSLWEAWDNFKDNIPTISEIISWWGNWWANVLTGLTAWWTETLPSVQGLIDSTLKTWFPFYDDLAALWSSIAEFFTNPFEFLLARFVDWFLGPEK